MRHGEAPIPVAKPSPNVLQGARRLRPPVSSAAARVPSVFTGAPRVQLV
jgi:hypothetical protein